MEDKVDKLMERIDALIGLLENESCKETDWVECDECKQSLPKEDSIKRMIRVRGGRWETTTKKYFCETECKNFYFKKSGYSSD